MDRGFSYYQNVRLSHSLILAILDKVIGHTFQIMGLICPLGTFCHLGRFVPLDVLSLGTFCPFGHFVPWDVLSLVTFCLGTFFRGTFCMCITFLWPGRGWRGGGPACCGPEGRPACSGTNTCCHQLQTLTQYLKQRFKLIGLGKKKITTWSVQIHYNSQNFSTSHSEERLVNLERRRERFVGLHHLTSLCGQILLHLNRSTSKFKSWACTTMC